MKYNIDINADLGEGFPYDEAIMPLISSCSIACGGHYGDENSIRKAIQLAKMFGVKVGAHPSFPDTKNFGRKVIKIEEEDLYESLVNQMQTFLRICYEEGEKINHIKLHGALYNLAAIDGTVAGIVIQSFLDVCPETTVYLPGNSVFFVLAKDKVSTKPEAFIDRSYTDEGFLVSRTHPGALLESPEKCLNQLIELVTSKRVTTLSGKQLPIHAETYCIHGDHPNSVSILKYLHQHLKKHSIEIE
ncbi:MAG: 5-oxoprolinase subunit PxpA [Flavobacteriaceae bacterium]|nr:5-oxoprolinase subunit PxpA [Flavobacteriaceae bacterium]